MEREGFLEEKWRTFWADSMAQVKLDVRGGP